MPDYRRLVSYIYNYEDGIKRNNIGYARVEARNGQCKCTIHVTVPSLNDKQLRAYMFKRTDNKLSGVLLGNVTVRNGIGEMRLVTEPMRLMNTNYSITDMGGIILMYSDKKYLATCWDEVTLTPSMVLSIENKAEESNDKSVESRPLQAAQVVEEKDHKEVAEAKEVNKEKEEVTKAESNLDKAEAIETTKLAEGNTGANNEVEASEFNTNTKPFKIEDNIKLEEDKIIEKKHEQIQEGNIPRDGVSEKEPYFDGTVCEESLKEDNFDPVYSGDELISDVPLTDDEVNDLINNPSSGEELLEGDLEEEEQPSRPVNPGAPINQGRPVNPGRPINPRTPPYTPTSPNNLEIQNTTANNDSFLEDHPIAKKLFMERPRLHPFEDNEIAWCVRIEPQDINMLPVDLWPLASNSFLLHGYYGHRHLIFAKVNTKGSNNYIIGIPGIYHNRERFMARMFGFENFKCAKRRERRIGEFGYWYLPVILK